MNTSGKLFVFDYSSSLDSLNTSVPQLYLVDTNCTSNRDGDTKVNCLDACPDDASKLELGSCGCGVAESDSDGDGVPNCIDSCAADKGKSSEGICGCGRSDADANSSGLPDCIDPTADTVPAAPSLEATGRSLRVFIPTEFLGVSYVVFVYRDGAVS